VEGMAPQLQLLDPPLCVTVFYVRNIEQLCTYVHVGANFSCCFWVHELWG